MTDDDALDITFDDPISGSEVEMLLFAIERSRAQFAWKVGGLDAAGLHKPFPPSTMTLGGLLKHLALVEDRYTSDDFTGEPLGSAAGCRIGASKPRSEIDGLLVRPRLCSRRGGPIEQRPAPLRSGGRHRATARLAIAHDPPPDDP